MDRWIVGLGGDLFGYGSFHVGLNWWGRFDLQSSGYGKFADNFVTQGLLEELNAEAGSGFMVFATLLILVLYGVANYFCVVKNWKLASINPRDRRRCDSAFCCHHHRDRGKAE